MAKDLKTPGRKWALRIEERDSIQMWESAGVVRLTVRLPVQTTLTDGPQPGTPELVRAVEDLLAGDPEFIRCRDLAAQVGAARQERAAAEERLAAARQALDEAKAVPVTTRGAVEKRGAAEQAFGQADGTLASIATGLRSVEQEYQAARRPAETALERAVAIASAEVRGRFAAERRRLLGELIEKNQGLIEALGNAVAADCHLGRKEPCVFACRHLLDAPAPVIG